MPRRYPNRRRRRPGRRPPHRYSGGFTPPGVDSFYRVAMPGLAGREKRDFFNGVARWPVAGLGLGGLILGLCWLGPLGAILGLAGGVVAGARFVVMGRFHRG
jgi:hypothetical protein